jgi:hypothetical protein
MLEGLDSIDWSKLTHAYGEASDVPGLLRQLASEDASERKEAIYELHGGIWHQGTIYEATAHAVPFLIELLPYPGVPDKEHILTLLSDLANGSSFCAVHGSLAHLKAKASTPEWQAQMQRELAWVRDVKNAVIAGENQYVQLLSANEPAVREAAGYLLATLTQPNPPLAIRLWEQFEREPEERVRASLLIGFGRLATSDLVNQSLLLNAFIHGGSETTRLAATLAMASIATADVPPDMLRTLFTAVADSDSYCELESSPWNIEGIELLVSVAVILLRGESAYFFRQELESALPTAVHPRALRIARRLLEVTFPKVATLGDSLAHLTDVQLRVLRLLARNKHVWVDSVSGEPAKDFRDSLLMREHDYAANLKRLLVLAVEEAQTFPSMRQRFKSLFGRR